VKIVVLDGYTLNPGDLSWDALSSLGDLTVYDRTPKDLIVSRCSKAEIIFTNKCIIDRHVIDLLPKLSYIGVLATGYNVVDCQYAKEKNIIVTNVPAYSSESVVQATIGLIIACLSQIPDQISSVKMGKWESSVDFSYYPLRCHELFEKTVGIIGYGKIGRRLAEIVLAFGAKVCVYNKGKKYEIRDGITYADTLEELLSKADIVSLNCPLTDKNQKMINKESISKMKRGSVLINTARGGLINELDLADALNSRHISFAGLDVLSTEPPSRDNPLLKSPYAYITPHTAWATEEARSRLMAITVNNLVSFLNGSIINIVNP
jgi:glycerate dehydrogenase